MISGSPWRIILVAEGPSDFRRIGVLVDHFLRKHTDGAASPEELRKLEGLNGDPYVPLHRIPELVRERGLDRRYSPGGPKKGDGGTLRKLYQVLQKDKLLSPRTVILWARDDDGDKARREDAGEARRSLPDSAPLLLAIATECGEAWVIAGWNASTTSDQAKLAAWRRKLGFEPQAHPDRLSHKENVPKSAKAIVDDIFNGDPEQEARALISAADSDSQASRDCGLHAFCEEARSWLEG
jgi:hypothetical protein